MVGDGRKVVAAAGTAEALAASTPIESVVIQAESDNTGAVVVGGSTVVAAAGTRRGVALEAGQSVRFGREDKIDNLNLVFLDVETSGEGVTFTYASRR